MGKILLQLPEGLKTRAIKLAKELKSKGNEVVIWGERCYGACDVKTLPGYRTLHYGHSKMLDIPNVEYEPWRINKDLVPVVTKALPMLPKKVGLASTIQHSHKLGEVKDFLESHGKTAIIIPKGARCSEEGQVLGCDVSGAVAIKDDVDVFLFIGTGLFHPMGIAYYTGKEVVRADPITQEVEDVDATKWIKARALRQSKAMGAKSFGVVVSLKPGQNQMESAGKICEKLESSGYPAYIIAVDELSPDKLLGFDVDAFIITACPRIVIDDWKNYDKPVLLPEEVEEVLNTYVHKM
ncbi:MAG: diphthamide biosynthesis enzyme Dph2 [Candidatus Diapherotrites archaeon]|nr:diphthamide biosynthesis enzyme Dph2 [Candidatus Diapherotrites archaeon]